MVVWTLFKRNIGFIMLTGVYYIYILAIWILFISKKHSKGECFFEKLN